ncbi:TRAP-type C4-dicarboxylate transport system, periplasmic component [plant metagenome]|uniref:TRAP-type C4-dicarboxylate transport system, periplasmic component n=1 Tax=plant metagenome TaxID=1297885 RepID=A0A484PZS1_9ZZZZ
MKPLRTLLAALPLALALPSVALAQTLKASDTHPAGYPTVVAVEQMGKKLEAATGGKLKIQMFSGGVLGTETEVVEQTQLGAVQIARISLGVVGPIVPDVNVFNLPYVFRDEAHMRKVVDGEIGQEILDKVTNANFNLVALGWMDGGTRHLYTKKPVRTAADLKGMKIRMQNNPVLLDTMEAMGGNGVAMNTGEIFSALQTGVIDGAENNSPTLLAHNHYQITKFFTQSGHLIIPELLVMSKRSWEKLTPEHQALVKKVAREAQLEQRELWNKRVAESNEKLKAAGVEFIEIDKTPFQQGTAPVREKHGAPYAELMKRIAAVQ